MDIFSALADPTRRNILEMLAANDELSASEIHDKFQVSPQAISQHLKVLREANMVHVEKRAQQRIYRINTDAMVELEEWSMNMRHLWNRRLDALEAVLKEEWKRLQNNAAGNDDQNDGQRIKHQEDVGI